MPSKKPPLGLMPKRTHDEKRVQDIEEAIRRYKDAAIMPPMEWFTELFDLRCGGDT